MPDPFARKLRKSRNRVFSNTGGWRDRFFSASPQPLPPASQPEPGPEQMSGPFSRNLPNSRNHIFSNEGGWRDRFFSSPPQPVPTESHNCFIDIPENIELFPGQKQIIKFKYYVGNPIEATGFRLLLFDNPNWKSLRLRPITTGVLPNIQFNPIAPFPDTLKSHEASVIITTPKDITYNILYADIQLTM